MTDLAQRLAAGQPAAVPKPSCIRPKPLGRQQAALSLRQAEPLQQDDPLPRAGSLQQADSRRATARDALDAVLTGVRLGGRDRQFLSRLVHWDKRNASSVASLLWRARLAGRAEFPERHWRILAAVEQVAQEQGKTVPQVALAWLLTRPGLTAPIMGVRNIEQLDDNLGALGWQLSPDELSQLDKASAIEPGYPYDFLAGAVNRR